MKIIVRTPGAKDQVVEVDKNAEQVEIIMDRRGEPWPSGEDAQLKAEWSNVVLCQIANLGEVHQRTPGAIRSRLEKLGLLPRGVFRE